MRAVRPQGRRVMENARYHASRCDLVTTGRTASACFRRACQLADAGGFPIVVREADTGHVLAIYTPTPKPAPLFQLDTPGGTLC